MYIYIYFYVEIRSKYGNKTYIVARFSIGNV